MAKSVLEVDPVSGEYVVTIPDEIMEELEWDEGEQLAITVRSFMGEDAILVTRK